MPIAELANKAQGLEGLTVVPPIDSRVSGLAPQDGMSFPIEALVAVPTISGAVSGNLPQEIQVTPEPESPEKHIGDLAPLREEPQSGPFGSETPLLQGGILEASDFAPMFDPDGEAQARNVQPGARFQVINGQRDAEGKVVVVDLQTGEQGKMFATNDVDSHLKYASPPKATESAPVPTETPVPEEVALVSDEPVVESEKQELEQKLSQRLLANDKQYMYWDADQASSTLWLKSGDGSGFMLEDREAVVRPDGTIRVKVRAVKPDGSIYVKDGREVRVWVNLNEFQGELANLTIDQLKELGFEVKVEEKQVIDNTEGINLEGFVPVEQVSINTPPTLGERTEWRINSNVTGYYGSVVGIRSNRWINENMGSMFNGHIRDIEVDPQNPDRILLTVDTFGEVGAAKKCQIVYNLSRTVTFKFEPNIRQYERINPINVKDLAPGDFAQFYLRENMIDQTPEFIPNGDGIDVFR